MARPIPILLDAAEQEFLALCYENGGRVIRHGGSFAVETATRFKEQSTPFIKQMKVEGYLRITKSSSRTGRLTKMLTGDLYVEELVLTQKGESFGKASSDMKGEPLYYTPEGDGCVYGALRDFGLEYFCRFTCAYPEKGLVFVDDMAVDLVVLQRRTSRRKKATGLTWILADDVTARVGAVTLGTTNLTVASTIPLVKALRYRPEQVEAWLTWHGDDHASGFVVITTRSRKMIGLPEQPTEDTLKRVLFIS